MSNFPTDLDDDSTLPPVNDNITEIGGDAINALREAVFNIENNIGLNAQGSTLSIAERLGVSLLPDGTIKPSVITNLGFVTYGGGGITNAEVNANAAIVESKLKLDHRTQDLFNYTRDLAADVNTSIGWISTVGIKLEPHLMGAIYRHTLNQIDVAADPTLFLKNKFRTLRTQFDSYQLINDINNELLAHQWADGSPFGTIADVVTNNGSTYPSNYAHTASGLFLDTSRFSTIPQTAQDLQAFAQFIDSSSIFLYGTRIQNLYSNGISKVSRSSNLALDGYGPAVVPPTTVTAYLQNTGMSSSPLDDIDIGDDIIEFKPSSADRTSYSFDEKFALVKPGDIVRINYGTLEVAFIIKEKKYISDVDPLNNVYLIRIAGKNLFATTTASARIDRSLVNSNKFGVLAVASAQILNGGTNALSTPAMPSLVVGTPRGAQALGLGFNPDQFDSTHYNLYLALFETGFPSDGYTILPAIDVTGNAGATPGKYTLDSIVEATNRAFRRPGFNYRFVAFSYKGEFGIMLADSYNNAAFSIVSAAVSDDGTYDQTATILNLPNNVVGTFATAPAVAPDPLGFGTNGSGVASPPYMTSYGSSAAALLPTKLFTALKRNNYYVDGTERDKLNLEVGQTLDDYGDGYWAATVDGYSSGSGKLGFTYKIPLDLSTSSLKIGKTLVVLGPGKINSGRFVITDVTVDCTDGYTFVSVYDAVHATALSPTTTAQLAVGTSVKIYFNSDSVSFNQESATDFSDFTPFKRHFEIYTDSEANTFTHERGRLYIGTPPTATINGVLFYTASVAPNLDIVRISPKLRGYQFGTLTKISLRLVSYDSTTGLLDGYLAANPDGSLKPGPLAHGKVGEVVRFYDESNIDYVDMILDINAAQPSFTNATVDLQLFPTLSLDDQIMMIGTCEVNDTSRTVSQIRDERQFGNTSEKEFSTSALDFISAPERLLHGNGVINGFDLSDLTNTNGGQIGLSGGTALVNGKFIQINPQTVSIPPLQESNSGFFNINWALCVNDKGEYQFLPLLDKFNVFNDTPDGPGTANRIFTAYNIVNGNLYTLDASTFGNLVSNRKDLTILYVVRTVMSAGPLFSVSTSDARKYVFNETSNISFSWVPTSSDRPDVTGSFNSVESLTTWINMYGNDRTNTIKVKGTFNVTPTSGPLSLDLIRNNVILEGDGATFNVTNDIGLRIKENIILRNIHFDYNPTTFTNTGNINGTAGCVFGDISLYDDYNKFLENIGVENCVFNSTTANHPPFICLRLSAGLVADDASPDGVIDGVTIRDNKFNDTTDHPAAIAILNTYEDQTDSLYWYAPTLANVIIENNICNKNQIFFLASTFEVTNTGLAVDSPGLNCFSVIIRNNKVGYIAYTSSGNKFYNINASVSNNYSNDSINIEYNNCVAIISPVDQTGKVPLNYIGALRNSYQHIPGTGNVEISNNTLSFISTVNRRAISNTLPASLRINDNKLEATNYANTIKAIFNFDVSPTVWSGQTFGVAIYVDHISLNTTESAVGTIIENNIINNTSGVVADPTFTNHYYEGGILTTVPCIVRGNIISGFAGMAKSGSDPLTFGIMGQMNTFANYNPNTAGPNTPLYAKANNNFIYRGAKADGTGGADFRVYVSGFNEVTDNFFDSSYCDNALTNTSVVTGAGSGNYRNKNQIYTVEVRAQHTGKVLGANNLTFNVGVDNTLTGYLEDLAAPATTGNPYHSGVDAAAVSIDSVRYTTKENLTAGDTTDGQLHVNNATGIKKVWVVSLDEFVPNDAHLFSVTTNFKISGGAGNKIVTLALVSEGVAGFDYSYAYGTATVAASGLSAITPLAIDTVLFPYTNLSDISLGKSNITVVMDSSAINGTYFFSNLIIKYVY